MRRILIVLPSAAFLAACGVGPGLGIRANGHPNRTLTASLGQTVELSFQSIGPGEYDTPPAITGASIRFVKMVPADVYVPAGVTQIYRFRAVSIGRSIITLTHSGTNPAVSDTIDVR